MYPVRFGEIAVRNVFITISQLKEALAEQISNDPSTRLRPQKLIGEILFEKGWITLNNIEIILEELKRSQLHPCKTS